MRFSEAGHQPRPVKSTTSNDLDEIGTAHLGRRLIGAVITASFEEQNGGRRIFGKAGCKHRPSGSSSNHDDVVAVYHRIHAATLYSAGLNRQYSRFVAEVSICASADPFYKCSSGIRRCQSGPPVADVRNGSRAAVPSTVAHRRCTFNYGRALTLPKAAVIACPVRSAIPRALRSCSAGGVSRPPISHEQ